MTNAFVKANILGPGANGARTENGAISYNTIGTALLDQFFKAGAYRGRDISDVWGEQNRLWAENPEMALRFPFYLRMITRQSNILGGEKTEKVQRGQGAKDESFKRLLWIAKYHPDEFYRNLWVLPIVGSWKDLWVLMASDDTDYLDHTKFFEVIAKGINDPNHKDLVKKFLPRIRSFSKCKTDWAKRTNALAKEFANFAGWSYKDYREFKSTGKAHKFQTVICSGLYDQINWNSIPGKALLSIVSGKFLNNHGLNDSYMKWLESQPVAKFNGYAFELGRKLGNGGFGVNVPRTTRVTIDKQFDGLIETAKKGGGAIKGNVLCGLDTSGSMTWSTLDKAGTMPLHVCLSLGIYFSELNTGAFHNVVAEFASESRLHTLSGTFSDKWDYIIRNCHGYGSTNFQSLVDLLVKTRQQHPEMPLEDFPKTLLVVSDMQFNPSSDWGYGSHGYTEATNYQAAINKLSKVFPKEFVDEFKIVWWYCANRSTSDFPSTMDDAGTYLLGGFDGAIISFVLGGEGIKVDENGKTVQPTMEEIANEALNQEALALIA